MQAFLWRLLPSHLPVWRRTCVRCGPSLFEATTRFRVNSNGRRHDVWLLYSCSICDSTAKRAVMRRVHEHAARPLDAYRRNDAEAAALWALALGRGEPVGHRVERGALPEAGRFAIEIEVPYPCRVRWRALLSTELGLARGRIDAGWGRAIVPCGRARRPGDRVRDGERIVVDLDEIARAGAAGANADGG